MLAGPRSKAGVEISPAFGPSIDEGILFFPAFQLLSALIVCFDLLKVFLT